MNKTIIAGSLASVAVLGLLAKKCFFGKKSVSTEKAAVPSDPDTVIIGLRDIDTAFIKGTENVRSVPFKLEYHNGTGYFDGIARDQELLSQIKEDEMIQMVSNDGRRILVRMKDGVPMIIAQRYSNNSSFFVWGMSYPGRGGFINDETLTAFVSGQDY